MTTVKISTIPIFLQASEPRYTFSTLRRTFSRWLKRYRDWPEPFLELVHRHPLEMCLGESGQQCRRRIGPVDKTVH